MSLYDAARRRLTHHQDCFCWSCRPGTPGIDLCLNCQARVRAVVVHDADEMVAGLVAQEGITDFTHLDHVRDKRSARDTPEGGRDQWL